MSGGHYDYAYGRVYDMAEADELQRTPLRKAFAKHLRKVAEAMRMVEWVDSDDCSPGAEDEAILAVLSEGAELEAAREQAQKAMADLLAALSRVGAY